ncbi:MAG: hypothetical protein IT383_20780 [Deltaproteobacteria bacterium]|nr:hypothetical protein [Deltaproteobacteria bacterium]
MALGLSVKELQSFSWSSGGKVAVQLKSLPKKRRVTGIMAWLSGTVANTSGGTLLVYPGALAEVLGRVFLESELAKVRATGRGLASFFHHMTGRQLMANPSTSIAHSASGTVNFYAYIPFADPRAHSPNDAAIPCELLEDRVMEFDFGDGATLGDTAGVTLSAGTLRTYVHTIDGGEGVIPTPSRIDYVDWAGQTAYPLPKGAVSHLMVYDESDAAVAPTSEYTRFTLEGDGVKLIDNVNVEALIGEWNMRHSLGAGMGGVTEVHASATDVPAEQLNPASTPFIPLVTPPQGYKLSQLLHAEENFRVDYSGSNTSARFMYRTLGDRAPEQELRALSKLGVAEPERAMLSVKTASKTDLSGSAARVNRLARLLPKRIEAAR